MLYFECVTFSFESIYSILIVRVCVCMRMRACVHVYICMRVCLMFVCTSDTLFSPQGFETAYESLKTLIADLSEQEITSALLAKVSKLGQEQEDVNYGLLCGIVTEPSSATEVGDSDQLLSM